MGGTGDQKTPYMIQLSSAGNRVWAPKDIDEYVTKGRPRFKIGDEVMAYYKREYTKGEVTEVMSEKTIDSYNIKLLEGEEKDTCTVLEDLNKLVRPVARFKKGTKVFANVGKGFVPGTIEEVYDPQGVYIIRLDAGGLVSASEDNDLKPLLPSPPARGDSVSRFGRG